jgi:CheY-like chemotaxis protein
MSHEIRTPMIGVLGMTDLLRSEPLTPRQRQLADTAHRSGEALLVILNDLLDFSKVEAGQLRLEALPFNPGGVATEVVDLFAEQAGSKGLELSLAIAAGVPDQVIGDPGRVRQIMLNLVGNAVKFTERGGISLSLAADEAADRCVTLRISVRDSGIGLDEEARRRIFLPFDQGETSMSRRYGGTGLGLSIVRELALLMQGDVAVESTPGGGSCFTVTLRLALNPEMTARSAATSAAVPAIYTGASGSRVLLVEDNPTTQELMRILLQMAGVTVTTADDGETALAMLAAETVDLIFMDCQMPQLDGLEATRRLRERGIRTPVVALTAHAYQDDAERCRAAGMDDFLAKPFRQQELWAVLAKWLPPASGAPPVESC